jgi:hypothetical protein
VVGAGETGAELDEGTDGDVLGGLLVGRGALVGFSTDVSTTSEAASPSAGPAFRTACSPFTFDPGTVITTVAVLPSGATLIEVLVVEG